MKNFGLIHVIQVEENDVQIGTIMITFKDGRLVTDIVGEIHGMEKIVDTNLKTLSIPSTLQLEYYLSNISGMFTIDDGVNEDTFLANFGLKDFDKEWKRFREKCTKMDILPEELEKKLGM